jgi:putative ABC transport system substrate-binding protein
MRRIGLAVVLALSLALASLAAEAQGTGRIWRVGVLATTPRPVPANPAPVYTAFLQELRNLGYVEGQNVIIEWRHTEGNPERRRREALTLMAWKPDVVVGRNASDAETLREADASVPIVLAASGDLVDVGIVDSLARPGGNITGSTTLQSDTAPKRLQILKELIPGLQRVALLHEAPSSRVGKNTILSSSPNSTPHRLYFRFESVALRSRRVTTSTASLPP